MILICWACNKRESPFARLNAAIVRVGHCWIYWIHTLSLVIVNLFEPVVGAKYIVDVSAYANDWEGYFATLSKNARRRLKKQMPEAMEEHGITIVSKGCDWTLNCSHLWIHLVHNLRLNNGCARKIGMVLTMPYRLAWAFFLPWQLDEYYMHGRLVGIHLYGLMEDRALCAGIHIHDDAVKSMIYWHIC